MGKARFKNHAARGGMTKAEVKTAVRQRDEYRCTECGMSNVDHVSRFKRQLEVHRIKPGSLYTLPGCVTLCMCCHDKMPVRAKGESDIEKNGREAFSVGLPPELVDEFRAHAKRRGGIRYCVELAFRRFIDEKERAPPEVPITAPPKSRKKPHA